MVYFIVTLIVTSFVFVGSLAREGKVNQRKANWRKEIILSATLSFIACVVVYFQISTPDQLPEKDENLESSAVDKDTLYRSTSHIVYDKITFGIDEQDYEKLMPTMHHDIGKRNYTLRPHYNNDGKLYLLLIDNHPQTANFIETDLYADADNLMRVISQKYGPPNDEGRPSFFDFKPGNILWQYSWNLYTKRILIGYKEEDTGSRYNMIAMIYDVNMKASVDSMRNQIDKDKTIKDSEKF